MDMVVSFEMKHGHVEKIVEHKDANEKERN